MADTTNARRVTNKQNAIKYAKHGLYVFPSSGKTPLIPRFNRIDTSLTPEERDAAIAEFTEKHGHPPVHVGSTRDTEVVKLMFKAHPDAVPSLATGPNKLVVLDADVKNNGPALLDALWAEHGGRPADAFVNQSQSGGRHEVFADPDGRFTNAAGKLADYGCDVRGTGGQIVAPGSIREDGKTYGTPSDRHRLLVAYVKQELPQLPDFMAALIGTKPEGVNNENVTDTSTRDAITEIENADWEAVDSAFDPVLGDYDIESFKQNNDAFKKLYDNPTDDTSDNRFNMARLVLGRWPTMPVAALYKFFEIWEEGAGEWVETGTKKVSGQYNNRDVAREWLKNQTEEQKLFEGSRGEAFDAVEDDDPELLEYGKTIAEDKQIEKEIKQAVYKPGGLYRECDIAHFVSPDYIIENLATRGQVGAIVGPPNVGKTFAGIDIGSTVSRGWDWRGLKVDQYTVLYFFGEGRDQLQNRLYAWNEVNDPERSQRGMFVYDGIPNLADNLVKGVKMIGQTIEKSNQQLAAEGSKPVGVIIIDTWAKAVAGKDENLVMDMQPILNALRTQIAIKYNVCVIIIHHTGKDITKGMRGSTAVLGDVDFVLEILDAEGAKSKKLTKLSLGKFDRAIVAPKIRDADKSGVLVYSLKEVPVGTNKFGNPATSLAVMPARTAEETAANHLGPVADDEAGESVDELTPEQNKAAREKRITDCEKLAAMVRETGTPRGTHERVLKAQTAADKLPKLGKFRDAKGKNYVRDFKLEWFDGDAEVDLVGGTLRLEEPGGRGKSAAFVFRTIKN